MAGARVRWQARLRHDLRHLREDDEEARRQGLRPSRLGEGGQRQHAVRGDTELWLADGIDTDLWLVQGLNTAQGNQMKNTAAPAQNNKAVIIQDNAEHATVDNQENVEPDNMKEVGIWIIMTKNIINRL